MKVKLSQTSFGGISIGTILAKHFTSQGLLIFGQAFQNVTSTALSLTLITYSYQVKFCDENEFLLSFAQVGKDFSKILKLLSLHCRASKKTEQNLLHLQTTRKSLIFLITRPPFMMITTV